MFPLRKRVFQFFSSKLMNWWNRRGNMLRKFRGEEVEEERSGPISNLQWEADYYLTPIPRNALFYEYLEMGTYPCVYETSCIINFKP